MGTGAAARVAARPARARRRAAAVLATPARLEAGARGSQRGGTPSTRGATVLASAAWLEAARSRRRVTCRHGLIPVATLVACAVLAPSALGQNVSAERLRELAAAARDDPAALEELREIDSVEGTRVDLVPALQGDESEVEERLATLAADPSPVDVSPGAARSEADDILSERRFRGSEAPRPLRGLLDWLADRLRIFGDAFNWLADRLPGSDSTAAVLLATLVLLAAAFVSARIAARRSRRILEERHRADVRRRADPSDLERAADEAERNGDLEEALRLRFRAGLLRLERANVIAFHESMTSGEVARQLRSREFDLIASTFDEVVYGRRPPGSPDLRAARDGWPRVLQEAGAR